MPWLRILFVLLVAQPVTRLWLGLTVRHAQRLPQQGPAIIVANHNSHLDVLALYALYALRRIPTLRAAAAADYFLTQPALAWFAVHVIGIVPVVRGRQTGADPLAACRAALAKGHILILFPEGTRGSPEQLSDIKSGLWHLAQDFPHAPVVPVYMHGLGRAMGRGQWLPVPFFVDIAVGAPLTIAPERHTFKNHLRATFLALRDEALDIAPSHPHEPSPCEPL